MNRSCRAHSCLLDFSVPCCAASRPYSEDTRRWIQLTVGICLPNPRRSYDSHGEPEDVEILAPGRIFGAKSAVLVTYWHGML
ncbi:hypothetical protein MPTK1_7g03870 [Marchantia polymorpha subsp. ruderalis]|uniref:Uncharacterized protein n=2 Tax=Marchantia polymorpha TaxID=3197 RepID=A0AAF6BVW9_MARPO|nr:hypothetical protein MARPO_0526s0001 [Marchantia polymorpha]BBN16153.1 hypothetical protein Mp_7g03870 [Marchantia polymorpha subsp. ruderalis]|eukprot:PTQ26717.1 hypothetical protein MARPO_0526s0001 [Marchantia polymorpha]